MKIFYALRHGATEEPARAPRADTGSTAWKRCTHGSTASS